MVRTDFSFLKLRIDECHSPILRLRALFSRSLSELSVLINKSETSWVEEFCSSKELQTFTKQREKHDRKLRHLLSKRSPVNSGSSLKDKWVMNLSSKELSALERSGLEKGLKFAIASKYTNHRWRSFRIHQSPCGKTNRSNDTNFYGYILSIPTDRNTPITDGVVLEFTNHHAGKQTNQMTQNL